MGIDAYIRFEWRESLTAAATMLEGIGWEVDHAVQEPPRPVHVIRLRHRSRKVALFKRDPEGYDTTIAIPRPNLVGFPGGRQVLETLALILQRTDGELRFESDYLPYLRREAGLVVLNLDSGIWTADAKGALGVPWSEAHWGA